MNNQETPLQYPRMSHKKDCLSPIILFIIYLWIVSIIAVSILAALIISSMLFQTSSWYIAIFQAGLGMLLALPLIPLALIWRAPVYRAIFRTWLLGSAFVIILAPVHIMPETAAQSQALLRIFLALIYTILVILLPRFQKSATFSNQKILSEQAKLSSPLSKATWLIAILVATIFAYPWLAWGALGSPLDTFLQVIFGFVVGLAATVTIWHYLLPSIHLPSDISIREYFLGGFSIGTTLLILSSGTAFPYGGMQLLLIICLPTLGWAVLALRHGGKIRTKELFSKNRWISLTLLIGLAAAAPMAFVDPDELILIVSAASGDILQWALSAAGISALIGLIASLLLSIAVISRRVATFSYKWARTILGALTAFVLILGLWIYFNVGNSGFYGEGLFVILKDQADISEARQMPSYNERRQYVYNTLTQHANDTQMNLQQTLEKLGIDYTPYYLVNGLQVQGGPVLRIWLQSRPEVDRVLDNPWMRPLPAPRPTASGFAEKPTSPTWNLTMINADRVWDEYGVTGAGIIIGQSDSGAQSDHPELAVTYRGGNSSHDYNWFDPWNDTTKPIDIDGHGTHSLGIIVGQKVGVAPGATWYGCVNLARNLGNPALYLNCMQFMLAPFPIGGDPFTDGDPTIGAHISNNSWGCPEIEGCDIDSLLPAVRNLRNAGVFVVASAGNDGPKCESVSAPIPIYEETFSVGSIDQFGQLSFFSSLGPVTVDGSERIKPNLVAPGDEVLSSMPNNTYAYNSGTSFAGPHVAGVVALMWSANPALIGDIERTEDILAQTAQPYIGTLPACEGAGSIPSTAVGYGIVDAFAAMQVALESKR